jgi:hypothetical protein
MKARERLFNILNNDEQLNQVTKNIANAWHDKQKGYPQITIQQISSSQFNHHDNKVNGRLVTIQVDIWGKGNIFEISGLVHKAMQKEKIEFTDERELNEKEVNRIMLIYKILEF